MGKNKCDFMELDKNGIATGDTTEDKIKLTVGVKRGTKEKVQYCITAIENG